MVIVWSSPPLTMAGAAGAMLFNYFVGQVIGTLGAGRMFFIMALLHPLAALGLWTLVRREQPEGKSPAPM